MAYHENWLLSNTLSWTPVSSTDAWNTVNGWNNATYDNVNSKYEPSSQWKGISASSPRNTTLKLSSKSRAPISSSRGQGENSSKFYEWSDIYVDEPNAPPQIPSNEFVNMETSPNPWVPRPLVPPLSPVPPSTGPSSPKESPSVMSPNNLKRNSDIEAELNRQNLYKTEMCRSWVENGQCRYGSKCQFAHGQHELRPVMRHPKYKTEICKTFHTTGTCPYGKRCRFIHHPADISSTSNAVGSSSPNHLDSYQNVEIPILPPPVFTKNDEEITNKIEQKLAELKISLLAPDPVFNPNHLSTIDESNDNKKKSSGTQKKGSRLPFFQKLRERKKH